MATGAGERRGEPPLPVEITTYRVEVPYSDARRPDEVREPHFPFLHRDTEVRTGELAAAAALVRAQTRPFKPHDYPNTHTEALLKLVEANV